MNNLCVTHLAQSFILMLVLPLLSYGAASTPIYVGPPIPDPPQQGAPWTSPATTLPRFLIDATVALFEQGMADPRGCDYREVELRNDTIWGSGSSLVKTRGWVLPAMPNESARFVVAWNGIVYPAVSVGGPGDLAADIKALTDEQVATRTKAGSQTYIPVGFAREMSQGLRFDNKAAEWRSPLSIRLCLLLHLGRADLAESTFAAVTGWKAPGLKRDLTDYGMSYLSIARDWLSELFNHTLSAHMQGEDRIAIASARRLNSAVQAITIKAESMGFPHQINNSETEQVSPYFEFLKLFPELLADQERRAKESDRSPNAGPGTDKAKRIAGLIRDLDQVSVGSLGQGSFGISLSSDAIIKALIAEGDEAFEPLIDAYERDNRLTRSVVLDRNYLQLRSIVPVSSAALSALNGLHKTPDFLPTTDQDRSQTAAKLRASWAKRQRQ